MLAEKKKTNKWLAEQVGKDPATISKWCTNTAQPSLEMLLQIAKVLNVEVKDLLRESDEWDSYVLSIPNKCRMSAFFIYTFAYDIHT